MKPLIAQHRPLSWRVAKTINPKTAAGNPYHAKITLILFFFGGSLRFAV